MRILIITRNLPPLVGGMERLNWHMAEELAKTAEVRVVGPAGSAALAPANVHIVESPLKPLWRFLLGAQWQAWRQARRWKPHWIIAGSGLTAPLAWLAAKVCTGRTAAYLHGLDIALAHRFYRAVWLPAIRRMDRVIANSSATRQLALDANVRDEKIGIVHPGVELPAHAPDADAIAAFRARHTLADAAVLLSVGRISERKGLREFVTDVLPRIIAVRPDAILVIIGDSPNQALYAKAQSRESIQSAADSAGVGKHLRFLGVITDREQLAAAYSAASVHVFPVRELPGDPEGFGMVAVEAACYGTPTVAYATGGVVDAVAEGKSGYLVPSGNSAGFAQAVMQLLANPPSAAALHAHAARFAWPKFGQAILGKLPSRGRFDEHAQA